MSLNMGYPMISCDSEIIVSLFFNNYPKLKNELKRCSEAKSGLICDCVPNGGFIKIVLLGALGLREMWRHQKSSVGHPPNLLCLGMHLQHMLGRNLFFMSFKRNLLHDKRPRSFSSIANMLMRGTWYFFCLRHMRMCFSEHITAEELWKMNLWDYMEVVDGIPAIFIFRSSWAIEIGQCKKQEGFFCFFVKHMCILPAPWPDLNSKACLLANLPLLRSIFVQISITVFL